MITVRDIEQFLYDWAPPETAESWDNVGLLVGRPDRPVRRVLVALDVTPAVAAEAAELPFDVEETTYTSYWGELAEICYAGGGQIADLRTSAGTEDNSGDYTDYPAVTELTVGTVTAELRGEAAERYTRAVWTDGQYAYSLRLSDGQSTEVWQRLLAGVRTEG